jgi:hypothetical protein
MTEEPCLDGPVGAYPAPHILVLNGGGARRHYRGDTANGPCPTAEDLACPSDALRAAARTTAAIPPS